MIWLKWFPEEIKLFCLPTKQIQACFFQPSSHKISSNLNDPDLNAYFMSPIFPYFPSQNTLTMQCQFHSLPITKLLWKIGEKNVSFSSRKVSWTLQRTLYMYINRISRWNLLLHHHQTDTTYTWIFYIVAIIEAEHYE